MSSCSSRYMYVVRGGHTLLRVCASVCGRDRLGGQVPGGPVSSFHLLGASSVSLFVLRLPPGPSRVLLLPRAFFWSLPLWFSLGSHRSAWGSSFPGRGDPLTPGGGVECGSPDEAFPLDSVRSRGKGSRRHGGMDPGGTGDPTYTPPPSSPTEIPVRRQLDGRELPLRRSSRE